MKISMTRVAGAFTMLAALGTAVLVGCSGDSSESLIRNTGLIVEGFYVHPNAGSTLVANTSGNPVSNLSLRQTGDQLEGFDNNGIRFAGTIGQVIENTRASFTLDGRSTSGQPATIAGNIDVDGTTATMTGTWIEPTLASTVFGEAVVPTNAVPPVSTNEPATSVTLNQTLVSLNTGGTTTFSASGGTGNYTWRAGNTSIGNITSISGSGNASATYTATGAGNNTVTVTDSVGESATATIRQSSSGGGGPAPVILNQSLVTVNADNGSAQFTVSGGEGDFTWTIEDRTMGRITSISGSRNANATYTANNIGGNVITATDEAGESASAVIVQELIIDNGNGLPPLPGG